MVGGFYTSRLHVSERGFIFEYFVRGTYLPPRQVLDQPKDVLEAGL